MPEPEPNLWLTALERLVEERPLVVLRLDADDWDQLRDSRRGVSIFTLARAHGLVSGLRVPAPCLIEAGRDGVRRLYLSVLASRSPITTLDSRLKVKRTVEITPYSLPELVNLVTDRSHQTTLKQKLQRRGSVIALSPGLSRHLIGRLASIHANHGAMRVVSESLLAPGRFRGAAAMQEDAVRTALKTFGLTIDDRAASLKLFVGQETPLTRIPIREDAVVEHDARHIPGLDLVQSAMTGRAVFERANERLVVITANHHPLESVFGVDLVYLNSVKKNLVMLQYKMLEPVDGDEGTDWVYRPDNQLEEELDRMRRFADPRQAGTYEYRLSPEVFYLKFVKRDGSIRNGSIITPIDHFERLMMDPAARGPRNGIRISYQGLSGRYLREGAFLDLVRSGYIGAYEATTTELSKLVDWYEYRWGWGGLCGGGQE